jgi:Arc/MetJ-type ribon-helix-helix transcriptional regulator
MSRLRLVAVKLTEKQLARLDAEVRRRRRETAEVAASRSSVLRDALVRLVEGPHA